MQTTSLRQGISQGTNLFFGSGTSQSLHILREFFGVPQCTAGVPPDPGLDVLFAAPTRGGWVAGSSPAMAGNGVAKCKHLPCCREESREEKNRARSFCVLFPRCRTLECFEGMRARRKRSREQIPCSREFLRERIFSGSGASESLHIFREFFGVPRRTGCAPREFAGKEIPDDRAVCRGHNSQGDSDPARPVSSSMRVPRRRLSWGIDERCGI